MTIALRPVPERERPELSYDVTVVGEDGERRVVRGGDVHEAVCELAGQVGIDLADGLHGRLCQWCARHQNGMCMQIRQPQPPRPGPAWPGIAETGWQGMSDQFRPNYYHTINSLHCDSI